MNLMCAFGHRSIWWLFMARGGPALGRVSLVSLWSLAVMPLSSPSSVGTLANSSCHASALGSAGSRCEHCSDCKLSKIQSGGNSARWYQCQEELQNEPSGKSKPEFAAVNSVTFRGMVCGVNTLGTQQYTVRKARLKWANTSVMLVVCLEPEQLVRLFVFKHSFEKYI